MIKIRLVASSCEKTKINVLFELFHNNSEVIVEENLNERNLSRKPFLISRSKKYLLKTWQTIQKKKPENRTRNHWVRFAKEHALRQIVQAGHHLSLRGWEGKENVKGKTVRVSSWRKRKSTEKIEKRNSYNNCFHVIHFLKMSIPEIKINLYTISRWLWLQFVDFPYTWKR